MIVKKSRSPEIFLKELRECLSLRLISPRAKNYHFLSSAHSNTMIEREMLFLSMVKNVLGEHVLNAEGYCKNRKGWGKDYFTL